jgi:hypothetical protein
VVRFQVCLAHLCAVVGVSTAHGRVLCRLGFHLFSLSNPQDVVTPYEDLSESARADAVYELLRVGELDVHVEVHRDESALVLGLTPLQPDDNVFVDPGYVLAHLVCGSSVSRGVGMRRTSSGVKDAG